MAGSTPIARVENQAQEAEATPTITPAPIEPITQYIWCSAGISKKLQDTLCQFIIGQLQANAPVAEYVFYMTTTGGDPFAAVNLYSFLKSLPIKTTVYNMGIIASAGVPFFLGFKNRYGVPNCSFMIHQTTMGRDTFPQNVNVFDLKTQLQLLGATDKKTIDIIEKETQAKTPTPLTSSEIEQAIERSQSYQADDALKYGFIDKIEQPEISKANIFYITDEYLNKS